jgi:hypothetical protein
MICYRSRVAIHLLDMLEVRNYDSFIGHDISPTG